MSSAPRPHPLAPYLTSLRERRTAAMLEVIEWTRLLQRARTFNKHGYTIAVTDDQKLALKLMEPDKNNPTHYFELVDAKDPDCSHAGVVRVRQWNRANPDRPVHLCNIRDLYEMWRDQACLDMQLAHDELSWRNKA